MPARKDDVLARQQLLGDAHGVAGRGAVVAEDDLELAAAEHAALGVDLLLRQLHAVAVGHGEGRHAAVGVELADLDGLALRPRRQRCKAQPGMASAASTILRRTTTLPYMINSSVRGRRPGRASHPVC